MGLLELLILFGILILIMVFFYALHTQVMAYLKTQGTPHQPVTDNPYTLSLRLQACERLLIYCERIAIPQLMQRINSSSKKGFLFALHKIVESEYEHNVSQSIYVSPQLWQIIQLCKFDIIQLLTELRAETEQFDSIDTLKKELVNRYNEDVLKTVEKAKEAIRTEANIHMS